MSKRIDKQIGWIGLKLPNHMMCYSDFMAVFNTRREALGAIAGSKLSADGYRPCEVTYSKVVEALIAGDGVSFDADSYKQFYRATQADPTSPLRKTTAHFSTVKPGERYKIKHTKKQDHV